MLLCFILTLLVALAATPCIGGLGVAGMDTGLDERCGESERTDSGIQWTVREVCMFMSKCGL